MRRLLLFISLIILMPLTLLAFGAKTDSNKTIEAELKSLKSQVASLEKRVKTLETQLADRALKDIPLIMPQTPQIPQVPKGWRKREFNGIPYYVIPLQKNPKK